MLLAALVPLLASAQAESRPTGQHAVEGALAFVGVHVVPMDREEVLRDQTVLVVDGKVARVGPVAEVALPAGAQRVEGRGRFLLPGFHDAHVHVLDEGDLDVYLANGITSVRNLKGVPWHLELRERIARGELAGPRLVTAGPFVNEPQVHSVEDVQRAVAEQAEAGYDCLKIHGELAPAVYEALLEEARLAGLPVVGHAPRNLPMERVLALGGQVEISHAEEYLYTFFDRLPGAAGDEDLARIARATVDAGMTVTPNLVAFRSIVRQIRDLDAELARPEMAWVAPPGRRGWLPDLNRYRRSFRPEDADGMAERYELLARFTRVLAQSGVRLLAGSDAMNPAAIPGFSLHEELELLVAAGLTPFQALRAATANAGEFLGDGAGVVRPGAPAELVLLAANPLEAIGATRRVEGVLAGGRWHPREELAATLAERARAYALEAPFMDRIQLDGFDEALRHRREAEERAPGSVVVRAEGLESLSLVYGFIGQGAKAREAAELATREHPQRWTAWTRLGEACRSLGDEPAARAAYARALELHPGDARIAHALEELGDD
jgi:amidohydrolase family protein/tetratricopeptide repeat protein